MNKVNGVLKILLGFLIISSTVYSQNQPTGNSAAKAKFTIDNLVHDYGDISESGGLASHDFIIFNNGDSPLVIKQVIASCGCTTPDWTKEAIGPKKTGKIKVAYNPQGRPGPFTKTITVYCENADPVQLTIKGNVGNNTANEAKKAPQLTFKEITHDFGTIGENDGYAEHIFSFTNTGDAPLTITRVTASCGCTKPDWTQAPVEPGKEGEIIITFNPRGRIGNFYKTATVFTNEGDGFVRHKLNVTGEVVDKPTEDPYIQYVDTIGGIAFEKNNFIYGTLKIAGISQKAAYIKNNNPETAYLYWENVPDYITVNGPDSLKAGWPGEIFVLIDETKTSDKRGRFTDKLVLTIKDRDGKILGNDNIVVTANYLDDFSKLSPLKTVSAPSLEIENTMINFGIIKRNASKQLVFTNKGKTELIIHSVTADDETIHLPDLKGKTIKTGESLTVNINIKIKELYSEGINTDIYVVTNDPKGPVRLINVIAQKAK